MVANKTSGALEQQVTLKEHRWICEAHWMVNAHCFLACLASFPYHCFVLDLDLDELSFKLDSVFPLNLSVCAGFSDVP